VLRLFTDHQWLIPVFGEELIQKIDWRNNLTIALVEILHRDHPSFLHNLSIIVEFPCLCRHVNMIKSDRAYSPQLGLPYHFRIVILRFHQLQFKCR